MIKSLKAFLLAVVTFAMFAAPQLQAASKIPTIQLTAEQQQSVNKISDYINSFQTLRSDFTQISPKGMASRGVLLISKPGKLRFEYAAPNPLLIVSDGRWLTIKDRVREKGDQFPLSATPLRLVVSPKIDLLAETNVVAFESAGGVTSVSLADRKDNMGGYITMIYDEHLNQLQQWVIVDGKGRRTTVQLANIETGGKFDPKLFVGVINRPEKKN
jgi:outer membrane lipoprotein-sorting protein